MHRGQIAQLVRALLLHRRGTLGVVLNQHMWGYLSASLSKTPPYLVVAQNSKNSREPNTSNLEPENLSPSLMR